MSEKKASRELLEELHGEIAKALKTKIASGEATAADLAVARQFLKDNGVDNIAKTPNSPLSQLADALPFPSQEGVEAEDGRSPTH
jgi:hypothetical protein